MEQAKETFGTVNAAVQQVQGNGDGSTTSVDATLLRKAARSERGKLDVLYVWDPEAENEHQEEGKRGNAAFPEYLRRV